MKKLIAAVLMSCLVTPVFAENLLGVIKNDDGSGFAVANHPCKDGKPGAMFAVFKKNQFVGSGCAKLNEIDDNDQFQVVWDEKMKTMMKKPSTKFNVTDFDWEVD